MDPLVCVLIEVKAEELLDEDEPDVADVLNESSEVGVDEYCEDDGLGDEDTEELSGVLIRELDELCGEDSIIVLVKVDDGEMAEAVITLEEEDPDELNDEDSDKTSEEDKEELVEDENDKVGELDEEVEEDELSEDGEINGVDVRDDRGLDE